MLITSDCVSTAESEQSSRELPRALLKPQEELSVDQTTFNVDDDEEPIFPVPAPDMVGVDCFFSSCGYMYIPAASPAFPL